MIGICNIAFSCHVRAEQVYDEHMLGPVVNTLGNAL